MLGLMSLQLGGHERREAQSPTYSAALLVRCRLLLRLYVCREKSCLS